MRTASPITPGVLSWALAEDGRQPLDIADAVGVSESELDEWVHGESAPTRGEVTQLAKALRRPRAFFFLPAAPASSSLLQHYRHPPGDETREVSPLARRHVRRSRSVQSAVAETLGDEVVELPRVAPGERPEDAAARARTWLDVTEEAQLSWRTEYEALAAWRGALEARGVLVFSLEIGRGEIRGFCAAHPKAPLIAVNSSGVKPQARCFTLGHELGHLVSREDAACIDTGERLASSAEERWCEEFGAALLMPRDLFLRVAASKGVRSGAVDLSDVQTMARALWVSNRAAALRLIDLGFAPRDLYGAVVRYFRPAADTSNDAGGPRSPRTAVLRRRQYGDRTLSQVLGGLPPVDAMRVLRMTVPDVREVAEVVPGVRAI